MAMLKGSSARKAGVLVSYAYMAAQILVQLVYVPLLLSCIGQAEYGLYQLVGSIMSYVISINGVLASGVGRYYCMYKTEDNETMAENTLAIAKRMYWVLSGISLVVVLVLIFLIRLIYANSFSSVQLDECSYMLIVLGINTVVTMNNTINIAAITAEEEFVFLKGSQLVTLLAQPVIVLVLTQYFPSALTVSFVVLGMNIICASAQRLFAQNCLGVSYAYHGWDKKLARELLGFSVAIILVTLADQIFWKTDQLIVGFFYGANAVAIYSVGSQVYTAYMAVGTSISSVFLPRVSELYHKNKDLSSISSLFARVGRVSFIVCALILGGFLVIGPDFVVKWAGERYSSAYLIAAIVMVPFTIDLIQNLGLVILQVANKYMFRGYMYLAIALLNVMLTIVLVQSIGLVGAAVSTALAMILGNCILMNWYYARRVGLDIRLFWTEQLGVLIPAVIHAVLFALLYWLLPLSHSTWAFLVLAIFAYVCSYAFVQWKYGLNDYEHELIRSLFTLRRLGDK